ncbi:autotransporter outer membrane beta-barrel domain-containing protein [Tabrizicola aquatica]|uniref:autotransporter outer membrane beta-barrel domain-containing protein n=1 Tax=Tabrizicola aquatica TaxID=909926 RepID=UPI0011AF05C8|nr:autotransporter outer membrane beta-barrel domain-containing protein [Tabrizicola aquatica]
MLHRLATRMTAFLGVALLCAAGIAHADNIPGSPAQVVPELTEAAADLQVRSIKDNMRPLREPGSAGISISTSGVVDGIGGSFGAEMPLALRLDYRDLDTDRLDGSLMAGSVLLGRAIGDRTLLFGGLMTERLDTDTLYNNGWIEAQGLGLALGLDYRASDRLFLTGILGHMALDYDVSRNGGITGSFDARRTFLDLSGDYLTRAGKADLILGFGLLYVTQKNDGYAESGGALVDGFTSDRLTGKLSARTFWGQPGDMRPYVDAEGFFRLSGSTGLPTALDPGDEADWSARLGVGVQQSTSGSGFDAGIGANFGDDAFEGLDAKLRYTLRF